MQTSGTFGALSDGSRKTVVGTVAAPKAPAPPKAPQPAKSSGGHRRGGYAKHAK